MKLNQDCVRAVLLELEEKLVFEDILLLRHVREFETVKKFGEETTFYALLKLIEANYIDGDPRRGSGRLVEIFIRSITWEGHDFLESIRTDKIWTGTKNVLNEVGSFTIEAIKSASSKLIDLGINDFFSS